MATLKTISKKQLIREFIKQLLKICFLTPTKRNIQEKPKQRKRHYLLLSPLLYGRHKSMNIFFNIKAIRVKNIARLHFKAESCNKYLIFYFNPPPKITPQNCIFCHIPSSGQGNSGYSLLHNLQSVPL